MPKGKISKAQERKLERLEVERLINARAQLVKDANNTEDLLENLPSFSKYDKNGVNVVFSTERLSQLDQPTKDWMTDMISRNQDEKKNKKHGDKTEEMFDDRSWYLVVRDMDHDGGLVGFSHFRFDMDNNQEVVFVNEIQLEESVRRKGLGKFMMQVLEIVAFKADMRKIVVAVFKQDQLVEKFFKECLKYETDNSCSADSKKQDIQIVSKFNRRKLAREEKERQALEAMKTANMGGGCKLSGCC